MVDGDADLMNNRPCDRRGLKRHNGEPTFSSKLVGENGAMTSCVSRLEAKKRRGAVVYVVSEGLKLQLSRRFLQMFGEDGAHLVDAATAGRVTTGFGRAKVTQMYIVDAFRLEAVPQDRLGQAGSPRPRHGSHIDQLLHAGMVETIDQTPCVMPS